MVRKTLADGTVKVYRYAATSDPSPRFREDSLGALILAYKASPEWLRLADATRATYATYLRVLEADPGAEVRRIARRDILALRDAIASTRGPGAATGFTRAASALFGWAVDREWIDTSPVHRIKALPKTALPTWTAAEVRLALDHLPEPFRRAVFLAAITGQRRGDLVAMRWADYDGAALRFQQQKTGRKMTLPLPAEARQVLDSWREQATADTILTDDTGAPWVAQRLTERLGRLLVKIEGMRPHLGLHGIRKFRATELASAGASVHQIAAVTGHKTLAMVALYTAEADQERLAGEVGKRLSPVVRLSRKPLKKRG